MSECQLNFAFPSFGLSVLHDEDHLLQATFYDLKENRPDIVGAKNKLTTEIIRQLELYQSDHKFIFDLPLRFTGTKHQQQVWRIMQDIKSGSTKTYGEVAHEISSAPRAVGGACGKNPFPIIIPCHRIIAANLQLGGFNSSNIFFNLGIKRWLLAHEGIFL